jgi:hypothetical protein
MKCVFVVLFNFMHDELFEFALFLAVFMFGDCQGVIYLDGKCVVS